jgi:hypothetical protein
MARGAMPFPEGIQSGQKTITQSNFNELSGIKLPPVSVGYRAVDFRPRVRELRRFRSGSRETLSQLSNNSYSLVALCSLKNVPDCGRASKPFRVHSAKFPLSDKQGPHFDLDDKKISSSTEYHPNLQFVCPGGSALDSESDWDAHENIRIHHCAFSWNVRDPNQRRIDSHSKPRGDPLDRGAGARVAASVRISAMQRKDGGCFAGEGVETEDGHLMNVINGPW